MGKHIKPEIKYNYVMRITNGESIKKIATEIMDSNLSTAKRRYEVETRIKTWIAKADTFGYTGTDLRSLSEKNKKKRKINYDNLKEEEKRYIIENLEKFIGDDSARNIYKKIEEDRKALPLSLVVKLYGIGRSTFYEWKKKFKTWPKELNEDGLNKKLVIAVKEKFAEELGMMGYQRMAIDYKEFFEKVADFKVTEHQVRKVYDYLGIQSNWAPRRSTRREKEEKTDQYIEDMIDGNFVSPNPNEKWFTDVTHVALSANRKSKTSIVIDSFNNELIDIKTSYNQGSQLTDPNIRDAILSRETNSNLIIQSDHGSEYVSYTYSCLSVEHNFNRSMSPKRECLKNRPAEFFFRIIKNNYFNNEYTGYKKVYEMNLEEFKEFMNWVVYHYNNKRRQPCLGNKTPVQYRLEHEQKKSSNSCSICH